MATSPWYREGTAKFTKGSTTVTGTGTRWVDFVRAGDGIQGPDGKLYQVTNVASNTSLSITPAYGSATTYWTIPVQGYVKQLADAAAQLVRDYADLGTAATRDVGVGAGQVMEVGARNWGHMVTPSTGLDFNAFTNRTLYPASGASYLYSAQNTGGPSSAGTHVLTMKLADDYQAQIGIQHSGRTYVRSVEAGTLRPWSELIRSASLLQATGTSTVYPMSQKATTDALATKANKAGSSSQDFSAKDATVTKLKFGSNAEMVYNASSKTIDFIFS